MTTTARPEPRVLAFVPGELRVALQVLRQGTRDEALVAAHVLVDRLDGQRESVQIGIALALVRRFAGENWLREAVQALGEVESAPLIALLADAACSRTVVGAELGGVVAVLAAPAHSARVPDALVAQLIERATRGEVPKRVVARLVRAVESRRGRRIPAALRTMTITCWGEMSDADARAAAWTLRAG